MRELNRKKKKKKSKKAHKEHKEEKKAVDCTVPEQAIVPKVKLEWKDVEKIAALEYRSLVQRLNDPQMKADAHAFEAV